MEDKKIWVEENKPIKEALELMTDEWIEDGSYCSQTVTDLRDVLKALIKNVPEKNNVINLATGLNDATFQTPEMCLIDCLKKDIGQRGAYKKGKKLFIICLDDNDDLYDISWNQAGMSLSEILSLIEVTNRIIIRDMGF